MAGPGDAGNLTMGFAISWVVLKGCAKDDALSRAQLKDTGEPDEWNETPISGAELPDGWYVIWLNQFDHPLVSDGSLARLAASCRVVAAMVEEHVMYSTCCEFLDGKLLWRVSHNAREGMFDLTAEGKLPEDFEEMQKSVFALQEHEGGIKAEVDYVFDIPLRAAQNICGFKHDETSPDDGGPKFTALR